MFALETARENPCFSVLGTIPMRIITTRFGAVEIEASDVLSFARGVLGFESCRQWILLADAANEAVGWLQCVTRPDLALPVVSPRRFAPEFQVRVARQQLMPIELTDPDQAYILVVVGKSAQGLTLNLRAPIIINLDRRLGCQVVGGDEQPTAHLISAVPTKVPLRKSA